MKTSLIRRWIAICTAVVTTAVSMAAGLELQTSDPSKPASRPAATRPASRPAAPLAPLTDRDSVEVRSEKYKVSFRVPKNWEKDGRSTTAGAAEIHFYGTPSAAKNVRMKGNALPPPPPPAQQAALIVGRPCHPGTTMEQLAQQARDALVPPGEGQAAAFSEDAATVVAGHPAWRLDQPFERPAHRWKLVDGKPQSQPVQIKAVRRSVVWLRGESFGQLDFVYDVADAAAMTRVVDQITASVKEGD